MILVNLFKGGAEVVGKYIRLNGKKIGDLSGVFKYVKDTFKSLSKDKQAEVLKHASKAAGKDITGVQGLMSWMKDSPWGAFTTFLGMDLIVSQAVDLAVDWYISDEELAQVTDLVVNYGSEPEASLGDYLPFIEGDQEENQREEDTLRIARLLNGQENVDALKRVLDRM